MNTCFVIESGWVIIGKRDISDAGLVYLNDASIVRKWDNGRGIGGIAKKEYKDEYILDFIGDANIRENKILFEIPCEW